MGFIELLIITVLISNICYAFSKPEFYPKPTSQDVTHGKPAILKCGILGAEAKNYTISWLNGGSQIVNNRRRFQNGSNLYFQPIDKDLDSDKFQCQAIEIQSGAEYVSDPVQFQIRWLQTGKIALKKPSSPSMIFSDAQLALKCNITGHPKPTNFSWYLNDTLIRHKDPFLQRKDGRLLIKSLNLQSYDGTYTCCVFNATLNTPNVYNCTPEGGGFKLQVLDRSKPRWVKRPKDKVVVIGSTVLLDCAYEAVPPPTIIWRRSGKRRPLSNKSRCTRFCIYSNGTLALLHINENWEDKYDCSAKQENTEIGPVSASVRLAHISEFKLPSTSKFVMVGDKFENTCDPPKSLPPAKITWTHADNGRVIGEDIGHIAVLRNTLVIDNVNIADAGVYTCTASNIAGRKSRNVTIELGFAPKFGKLLNKQVTEGSNVTWTCPVDGKPSPEIKWFKDSVLIKNLPGKWILKDKELILVDVSTSAQGAYYCDATNQVSRTGSSYGKSNLAQLRVTERLKFSPVLKDMCIAKGEKKMVTCSVKGSEIPQIKWTRLNATGEFEVQTQDVSSHARSLVFEEANNSSAGKYRCTATALKLSINVTIRIDVVDRPKIEVPPQNKDVIEGKAVRFDCGATKAMSPVTWRFGDHTYGPSESDNIETHLNIMSNGSLIIPKPQTNDRGTYTCSYINCDISVTASAVLNVSKELLKNPYTDNPDDPSVESSQRKQTIAFVVAGCVVYILLTIAFIVYCRRKRRKQSKNKCRNDEEETMLNGVPRNGISRSNHGDEILNMNNAIPMQSLSRLDPEINNLSYPAENIDPVTVIGKGEFGEIFLSKAPGLFPDLEEDILVMVKAYQLRQEAGERTSISSSAMGTRSEFNREVNLLHRAQHDNVVKLLGVCSKYSELKPDHLITEYLEWEICLNHVACAFKGILKLCLEASKDGRIPKLSKNHKMNICCQLACGLDHLNKLGLVHKDIATRNCVISSQLLVKISVLGLSREGFEAEYCDYEGKRVPVRWMAPEALFEGNFSSKSDVWSFAVACWETFTLGETPYVDFTDEEYIEALQSEDPPVLPSLEGSKRITSLIKKCSLPFPNQRPEIKQIMRKLQSIIGSGDAPENDTVKAIVPVATEMGEFSTEDTEER